MKPVKKLTIGGEPVELVTEDVRLNLHQPGRASFTINGAVTTGALALFDIGYQPNMVRYFVGWVAAVNQINSRQQLVVCRELSATLDRPLPLRLRRVAINTVLAAVSDVTGLTFRLPDEDYAKRLVPHFYHVGGGYHLMDSLGEVFGIDGFIWQQQGNGEVFVGSWADSFWADKPVAIPAEVMDGHMAAGTARIAMVPRLRPGVYVNGCGYITALQLINGEMVLTCAKVLKK